MFQIFIRTFACFCLRVLRENSSPTRKLIFMKGKTVLLTIIQLLKLERENAAFMLS